MQQETKDKVKNISLDVLERLGDFCEGVMGIMIDPYESFSGRPRESYDKRQIYSAVGTLKRRGYITSKQQSGKTLYALTEKGLAKIEDIKKKMELKNMKFDKWDGYWHLVIFDIPEKQRVLRNGLRDTLIQLGFRMFQASVWVYPYDVFDELEELIPDIKKHGWIKLLVAKEVVGIGEDELKKMFDL